MSEIKQRIVKTNGINVRIAEAGEGGVVLPWLQGKVLVGAGPSEGVFVTSVLCAGMFVLAGTFRRRHAT